MNAIQLMAMAMQFNLVTLEPTRQVEPDVFAYRLNKDPIHSASGEGFTFAGLPPDPTNNLLFSWQADGFRALLVTFKNPPYEPTVVHITDYEGYWTADTDVAVYGTSGEYLGDCTIAGCSGSVSDYVRGGMFSIYAGSGIHAIMFGGMTDYSYVGKITAGAPEPGTLWLLLTSLIIGGMANAGSALTRFRNIFRRSFIPWSCDESRNKA